MYRSIVVSPSWAWEPPSLSSLWAWFKFNEGSGTTIIDYSPNALNGYLVTVFGDPTTKFWSVPGFGHNDNNAPTTWAARYTSDTSVNYVSLAGFIRPKGYDADNLWYRGAMQVGHGGYANWLRVGWSDSSTNRWRYYSGNIYSPITTSEPISLNTWVFVYAHSTPYTLSGRYKMELWMRYSGGSLTMKHGTNTLDYSYTGTQTGIFAFGSNNGNYIMDGGDMFYYASSTSSSILTEAQINSIYEACKDRYGMT